MENDFLDARAILAELTQREYGLDPADIPNEATRMAHIAATILHVIVDRVIPDEPHPELSQFWDDEADREWQNNKHFRHKLLAIVNDLEAIL